MKVQIGEVVGDYKVIDAVGTGGMGAVYKIEHVITKRIEAMKLLPSGLSTDPAQVLRFEREIQVQARLHHPNIAGLYNAIRDERSIALIMEFVEGESLQHILESGPLPLQTSIGYAAQVLSALAYAHDAGVIHRDVSPANIIITPDRSAKLTDFGLARAATDPHMTSSGVPVGSPWYMSPEQVRNLGEMDARTDIYAMGAVLYEMLTGAKLFEGGGAFEVMRAQTETTPAPPSARNPEVPAAIDKIILKALAKDPAERFQSAAEFRSALENVAPPAARPVKSGAQAARPVAAPATLAPPLRVKPDWRLPAFHPSRAALLMVFGPAALVAGLCTIRLMPKTQRVPPPVSHAQPAAPATSLALPEPPLPPSAPVAKASVPAPAEPLPVATRLPSRPPFQLMPPPVPAPRHAAVKPAQNFAIRVSGGAIEPPAAPASPVRRTVDLAEPPLPKPEPAALPEVEAAAAALAANTDLDSATQDAVPAKPEKGGNRFVRALGKINPFRKGSKDEPGDSKTLPATHVK